MRRVTSASMTRRFLVSACVFLSVSCGRPSVDDAANESSLTILYDADERIFGPYWSVDAWFLMFLPLVAWDEEGRTAPRLARSWEYTSDFRQWTFHLRPDVRWHDGQPVTAHDIKFSIELSAHPDVLYEDAWHDLDSITVHDDTTFTMSYSRPKDARNNWLVYWPKHLLEELDPSSFFQWEFWSRPVGNGPYRYVRHVPKTMMELEANPDFFDGPPSIDRLIIKFGGSAGITELLSGNVDVLTHLNQANIPSLGNDPRFQVYHQMDPQLPWFMTILWNHRHPALADPRVRRALTMAIDRPTLLAVLNLPPSIVITDAPMVARHDRALVPEPLPYDPEGARVLLADAGWLPGGTSAVTVGRRSLSFEALVTAGDVSQELAVLIQASLRMVGVDMQIRVLDASVVRDRVGSGDFDAAFQPVWNNVDAYLSWFGAESPLGYENADVQRLMRSIKETMASDRLDGIYGQLTSIIQQDMPVTFLYAEARSYAVPAWLRGLESPYRADPTRFLEKLWIER